MGELKIEVDPAEVGLDEARLRRMDDYFQAYVDDGRLPGWSLLVSKRGQVAHLAHAGYRHVENGLRVDDDTIWRLASLTKPIVSVAAMMLYEQGAFGLHDPMSDYIPAFGETRVYRNGMAGSPNTDPLLEPIRIWHLLTHTSGLTVGAWQAHPVEQIYAQAGYIWDAPPGVDLAGACEGWAGFPLLFTPGTQWNYGVSVDVLGRVLEVITGKSIDEVLADLVLGPLGMTETSFWVDEAQTHRVVPVYSPGPEGGPAFRNDPLSPLPTSKPTFLSAGGGLFTTLSDYHRFCQFLLGGGELHGTRLLGTRTLAYMGKNHLPGGADLAAVGRRVMFGQPTYEGLGFGLGFQTVVDAAATKILISPSEISWYSGYSTLFMVDPIEQLSVQFFSSFAPVKTYPLYGRLRQLAYQALID
ncbi:serine hydrolase domain-containing protein [Amycolatopsis roodepoortensis]|uniref:CubicO group peptidase (Beta-lactamase class C family) n=1 Tax=Amycolatopsis roodepoortensis TaxID=700274 RepID=A0ABR9L239_9PSEU|nr:serine hydrolase domain-containing protein [Amycolatopsis roodepoortensis]MBE1574317.1 CubicO group peptidase (beta-lactamase class C family) [Amycolatopsis roodepoortensis]